MRGPEWLWFLAGQNILQDVEVGMPTTAHADHLFIGRKSPVSQNKNDASVCFG